MKNYICSYVLSKCISGWQAATPRFDETTALPPAQLVLVTGMSVEEEHDFGAAKKPGDFTSLNSKVTVSCRKLGHPNGRSLRNLVVTQSSKLS